MKVPSIVRLPKYKRFDYEPRHYDPIKEEIEERTYRIKKELEAQNLIEKNEEDKEFQRSYSPSITFRSNSQQTIRDQRAVLIRLIIVAVLSILTFGFIYYGERVLYSLFLVIPVYIYFRFRGRFGKRK